MSSTSCSLSASSASSNNIKLQINLSQLLNSGLIQNLESQENGRASSKRKLEVNINVNVKLMRANAADAGPISGALPTAQTFSLSFTPPNSQPINSQVLQQRSQLQLAQQQQYRITQSRHPQHPEQQQQQQQHAVYFIPTKSKQDSTSDITNSTFHTTEKKEMSLPQPQHAHHLQLQLQQLPRPQTQPEQQELFKAMLVRVQQLRQQQQQRQQLQQQQHQQQ